MTTEPNFIIQIRSNSKRLPAKMLLPFYNGLTIPQILIRRIQKNFVNAKIIVATTNTSEDDQLVEILSHENIYIYRGSESDVLQRFVEAGEEYQIEECFRICADNPFLDISLMQQLLVDWNSNLDYLSFKIDEIPAMKTGFGFFAEITKISILRKVIELTKAPIFHEHVTNFVYENPSTFNIHLLPCNDELIKENAFIRLTVDTKVDFDTTSFIYKQLSELNEDFDYRDAIGLVKNSSFIQLMKEQALENKK